MYQHLACREAETSWYFQVELELVSRGLVASFDYLGPALDKVGRSVLMAEEARCC